MVYPIKCPPATILLAQALPISCLCAGRVSTIIARHAACTNHQHLFPYTKGNGPALMEKSRRYMHMTAIHITRV